MIDREAEHRRKSANNRNGRSERGRHVTLSVRFAHYGHIYICNLVLAVALANSPIYPPTSPCIFGGNIDELRSYQRPDHESSTYM